MTKRNLLWTFLAVAVLVVLFVSGNILTRNMQNSVPPVVVADSEDASDERPSGNEAIDVSEDESAASESQSAEALNSNQPETSTYPDAGLSQPSGDIIPPTAPPTTPPTSSPQEDSAGRIEALVKEVYALRDYYTAQLAYLELSAQEAYDALLPEEKTPEKKREMALSCIDKAYALENECDSRMDEICTELSYLLLKTDGDMSLVSDIRYAYASQKERAKNQFLEKYADYFG